MFGRATIRLGIGPHSSLRLLFFLPPAACFQCEPDRSYKLTGCLRKLPFIRRTFSAPYSVVSGSHIFHVPSAVTLNLLFGLMTTMLNKLYYYYYDLLLWIIRTVSTPWANPTVVFWIWSGQPSGFPLPNCLISCLSSFPHPILQFTTPSLPLSLFPILPLPYLPALPFIFPTCLYSWSLAEGSVRAL